MADVGAQARPVATSGPGAEHGSRLRALATAKSGSKWRHGPVTSLERRDFWSKCDARGAWLPVRGVPQAHPVLEVAGGMGE